jgi:beta-1,4-mannosyltransferase
MWTGARGDAHFCVSEAMKADLDERFGIRARVLYDRPLRHLAAERGEILTAVCPAGWTADENMGMLIDAIALLPAGRIEFHLTGHGPEYARLEPRIGKLREAGHAIRTGFLSDADYWALIARADIGISMHGSSSGLDLAMKVVDLFSGGVPVCAFDYGGCVREQIREGRTGFLFQNAAGLEAALSRCVNDPAMLAAMRRDVLENWSATWSEEWKRVAAPALDAPTASLRKS